MQPSPSDVPSMPPPSAIAVTTNPGTQTSPVLVPGAPTPPATSPPTLASPVPPLGTPTLPAISDTTNPAALEYVIQYPMFGNLPFRRI